MPIDTEPSPPGGPSSIAATRIRGAGDEINGMIDRHNRQGMRTGDGNVSTTVVERIADRVGVAPEELEPRLHDVVDADALDQLFDVRGDGPAEGSVVFRYAGYRVVVRASGEVEVSSRPESGPGTAGRNP